MGGTKRDMRRLLDETNPASSRHDEPARWRIVSGSCSPQGERGREIRHVTMAELAAAAKVGALPVPPLPAREALERALDAHTSHVPDGSPWWPARADGTDPFQTPHSSVAAPVAIEVTRILDELPPHLVADQLMAEVGESPGSRSRCASSTSTARTCRSSPASRSRAARGPARARPAIVPDMTLWRLQLWSLQLEPPASETHPMAGS